jgi:6-pyruvoyltetrahydropterin/6-carboxytetrahydropterin synthase
MPLTCAKSYADIPIAHRQPHHDGHCSLVHGHSWTIRVTFAAETLDRNGFVVDFGGLGYLRDWIERHLDHGILLAHDDDDGRAMVRAQPTLFKPYYLEHPSCEGLSAEVFRVFRGLVREREGERVEVVRVEVWEDPRNMTTYE